MNELYRQKIDDLLNNERKSKLRTLLAIVVFDTVYIALCYLFLQDDSSAIVYLAIFGFIFLNVALLGFLGKTQMKIRKIAVEGIGLEETGFPWKYWAASQLAPAKAFRTRSEIFPIFGRSSTCNYVISGRFQNIETTAANWSVWKSRGRNRSSIPGYGFNGHSLLLEKVTISEEIIVTDAEKLDFYKIPFGFVESNGEINGRRIRIYTKSDIKKLDEVEKLVGIFEQILMSVKTDGSIIKSRNGTLYIAINDDTDFLSNFLEVGKKTNAEELINEADSAVKYCLNLVKLVVSNFK